ncbi:LuxR family transcriptional regulator [Agromyces protaetiae]|uniref:LuxR family transcriptional regulator n=1 Tax=Agromyces protaetiae TaxID=2509455 RepID=A0A4P6FF67_9MICO|nr:LuxR family transcriptional regulator [Agromyces protaetiae]
MLGRLDEQRLLDRAVAEVRSGRSRTLVIRGESGVGKSALCDLTAERATASGCLVVRVTGVQSEMELASAALHQLCLPLLGRLDDLPEPQRDALATTFGLVPGPPPNRFLVGLGVLSLLAAAAAEHPLVCVVDDAHWLDRASAQALGFVARRLDAEGVGLLFAVRTPHRPPELEGLPSLEVAGLAETDAAALLDSVAHTPLDARVRRRLLAETRGNPLAILEIPRLLRAEELSSGYVLPADYRLAGDVEAGFRDRVRALPTDTRLLLLVAAAEPFGDPVPIRRAALGLGVAPRALAASAREGLSELGPTVRFRHPLVRSAVYRSASPADLRRVHGALAAATDASTDPDRHAWHAARAAAGPDEQVAGALDAAAARSLVRGAPAAAAAFLRLAIDLSVDPTARAQRALEAAHAEVAGGDFHAASALLATARSGPLDERSLRRADVLLARIAFATARGRSAVGPLVDAADALVAHDRAAARATYLEALGAALFAGPESTPGPEEIARRAVAALFTGASPPAPTASELVLQGLAEPPGPGRDALLRASLDGYDAELAAGREWLPDNAFAGVTAIWLWDDERLRRFSMHHADVVRASGATGELPLALLQGAFFDLFSGDLAACERAADEVDALIEVTGTRLVPFGALALAAMQGDTGRVAALVGAHLAGASERGEGSSVALIRWTEALLANGLGRYADALAPAQQAAGLLQPLDAAAEWALAELVEAAARTGALAIARDAEARLAVLAAAAGTDWGLGVAARSRAFVVEGVAAESAHREAIARLSRTCMRIDLARARLVFGEWLRREHRTREARDELGAAFDAFAEAGADGFAARAERELRAAGASARVQHARDRASERGGPTLTPQEEQIARLASGGLSNPEIAGRLFLSTRTVEYHLHKVFAKLAVSSRHQLAGALPDTTIV